MRKKDFNIWISIALVFSISITGFLGWVQSTLELRRFTFHRYAAYTTLILAALHLIFNFKKVTAFLKSAFKGNADNR